MSRMAAIGLWHLGCVASTAFAHLGHTVTGTDFDQQVVRELQQGHLPLYEPGLAELMAQQVREGRLSFVTSGPKALSDAEYAYITIDTPVDENDQSDLTPVEAAFDLIADHAKGELGIVLMSQVPVRTCGRLAQRLRERAPHLSFTLAYQPENLQLGQALKAFLQPDLIVLGTEEEDAARRFLPLYEAIQAPLVRMSWNSAEMVKHAINAFLATSVSFVNELAGLAEVTRADMRDVVRALRLDRRIGPHAFVSPGPGFSGGTLARDIQTLRRIGQHASCPTPQLDATLAVNAGRLPAIARRIQQACGNLKQLQIALLGLTYKPGTSTLRRSNSLALARLLMQAGHTVRAFDPMVPEPQTETQGITLCSNPYQVAECSDAVVVMTPWPEFKRLDFIRLRAAMRQGVLFDAHNCLDGIEARNAGLRYLGIGVAEDRPVSQAIS